MAEGDWVEVMFPGDGLELPTDQQRDLADATIRFWSEKWNEPVTTVARVHPDTSEEGFASYLAGRPTNRAYLRSMMRRWWAR